MKEAKLQEALIKLIDAGTFVEAISDVEGLDEALKIYADENYIPSFEIDSLLRRRYSESGKRVVSSLSIYDVISMDGFTNISLERKEKLLPDCILFNPETQQIIIIENKTHTKATRETMTELFGYAQEIRNHLPFASHLEISFIIISTEFPTLLDHSVSSQILSTNCNVLCLIPTISESNVQFDIHFPKSWTDIGQDYLSENGLVSYTLCLKVKDNTTLKLEEAEDHLRVACDLLVHEAQRYQTSGVYLLWKNTMSELFKFEYGLTIYMLNPFSFLVSSTAASFTDGKDSPLLLYMKEHADDLQSPGSLLTIAGKAHEYLSKFFDTEWDRSSNWAKDINDEVFCSQRMPLNNDSWGVIGSFIRDAYLHPGVRKNYLLTDELNGNGYLTSFVSFQLLTQITGTQLFRKGAFFHQDTFAFGVQLQRYASLAYYIHSGDKLNEALIEAELFWQSLALLTSIKEVMVRLNDLKMKIPDDAKFTIALTKEMIPKDQEKKIEAFVEWFDSKFLGLNKSHARLFRIGFTRAIYFSIQRETLDKKTLDQFESELANEIKLFIVVTIDSLTKKERILSPTTEQILKETFNLQEANYADIRDWVNQQTNGFYTDRFDAFLEVLRYELGQVYHQIDPWHIPASVDWTWFINTARSRFLEGKRFTVFEITSNGSVQIGQLNPEERYLGELNSVDEVFFKIHQAGIATIHKTAWSELKSGGFQYK